jgi:hypothetical protein
VDRQLEQLLAPYLERPKPAPGQSQEQADNAEAHSLGRLARTYLDWDGPLAHPELVALVQRQPLPQ